MERKVPESCPRTSRATGADTSRVKSMPRQRSIAWLSVSWDNYSQARPEEFLRWGCTAKETPEKGQLCST